VQQDLARFGLFIDRALQMGLSPQQTEQIVREVKASPSGELSEPTRAALIEQVQAERDLSWPAAQREVGQLERYAANLPHTITAFGLVNVPTPEVDINVEPEVQVTVQEQPGSYDDAMQRESAMGGSGNVIGGGTSNGRTAFSHAG
jgi:hypothetical protein